MFGQVVAGRRQVLGDQHTDTLDAKWNYGLTLMKLKEHAIAEKVIEEVVVEYARQHGPDYHWVKEGQRLLKQLHGKASK